MAVKLRMKKLGRTHRPFFRICAADCRSPRDGKVIEELGTYDPMVKETDARVSLNNERVDYWLSVGAQPSQSVKTFIKKYGTNGTHLEAQAAAKEKLKLRPTAPAPVAIPLPTKEDPAAKAAAAEGDAPAADAKADAPAEEAKADAKAEAPAEEAKAEAPAKEAKADDAKAEKPAKEEAPAKDKAAEEKPAE